MVNSCSAGKCDDGNFQSRQNCFPRALQKHLACHDSYKCLIVHGRLVRAIASVIQMHSTQVKKPGEDFYEAAVNNDIVTLQRYLKDGGYMVDGVKGFGRHSVTALILASQHGRYDAARILLEHGCDVNRCARFWDAGPLHFSAANGHLRLVELLLRKGGRVNAVDRGGVTPLMTACQAGHVTIAKTLLRYGANIDQCAMFEPLPPEVRKAMSADALSSVDVAEIKDPYEGNNAFLKACWKGLSDIVDVLWSHDCNINVRNTGDNSGLHVACREGHFDIVAKLLKYEIDVNAVNSHGQTALHVTLTKMFKAAGGGDLSAITRAQEVEMYVGIAKLLIHSGCDATVEDVHGFSPTYILLTGDFMELHGNVGTVRLKLLQLIIASTTNITLKTLPSQKQMALPFCRDYPDLLERLQNFAKHPRRLKHLSRCAVRKLLGSCSQTDISSLCLPAVLQKYLYLDI